MKLVTWNMAHREGSWHFLLESDADIAMLQETPRPPRDLDKPVYVDSGPWKTGGGKNRAWRTAIANISNRIDVEWIESTPVDVSKNGCISVSRSGTLSAASIKPVDMENFVIISMYGLWETPYESTGSGWIYADSSVHRLISDLAAFIGQQSNHRIIVAGDLNILYGYGENGNDYWASRYETVFSRMKALGLEFVGPQYPNGIQASPWPSELPRDSKNVPTYFHSRQSPSTATRQLDFVFASKGFSDCMQVTALNTPEQWGPSDHCRVEIELI